MRGIIPSPRRGAKITETEGPPYNPHQDFARCRTPASAGSTRLEGDSVMYKKILVPLDGSENDAVVLEHVKGLAKEFGGAVTLIMLFRLTPSDHPFQKQLQLEEGSSGWRAKRAADSYLPEAEHTLAQERIPVTTEFLAAEQPEADTLVKYAEEKDYDLIVFANRERSPIGRFFFGNLEEKVRRRTTLPVLFVSARPA